MQARAAWTAFRDREVLRETAQGDLAIRRQALAFDFGDKVAQFCSAPSTLSTADLIDRWEVDHGLPFSAENCFIQRGDARCRVDLTAYAGILRDDDLGYQLCVAGSISRQTGQALSYVRQELTQWANTPECRERANIRPATCADGTNLCLRCGAITIDKRTAPSDLAAQRGVPTGLSVVQAAEAECRGRFPNAQGKLPSFDAVSSPALDTADCYRGSLGAQVLTLRSIAKDVEIARSELAEHQERYDIVMNGCMIAQLGQQRLMAAQRAHNKTMSDLRTVKLAFDVTANVASASKDCAAVAGSDPFFVAGVIACSAAAAEGAARSVSDGMVFAMEEAEQSHELLMTSIQDDIDNQQCFNDAELELVGARTSTLRVQRALQDLDLALFQLREMKIAADTYYADGKAALAVLEGRTVVPPSHDFWLDEAVTRFDRRMAFARRLTYLSVLAVEYEYQQSLSARSRVLSAVVPDDLEAVLQELWSTAGTRTVAGNRPASSKAVISLRDQVLQLADATGKGQRELPLSDLERFRLMLTDPQYARFAEDGTYLGQSLPFALAPLGRLGLGQSTTVPAFTGSDCAERLWSVSASVQGGAGLTRGSVPSVRVQLVKSNTFYSQWCRTGMRPSEFQVASVRPSKNLLRGDDAVTGTAGMNRSADTTTVARLEAFLNVPVSELINDTYANGDTSELAARGLFGDYELFFPAASLSRPLPGGARSDGLVLEAIDDVLLRVEYVSVARR
jgi:hypothetical protein